MSTYVSDENIVSFFRVEKEVEQEISVKAGGRRALFGLFFDPENGGDMFLRNIG
jgi:hypothetical protein